MATLSAASAAQGLAAAFMHGPPASGPQRTRVVILGGGFAGVAVAHNLEKTKTVDITLVDTKDYFEVSAACFHPHCLLSPQQH